MKTSRIVNFLLIFYYILSTSINKNNFIEKDKFYICNENFVYYLRIKENNTEIFLGGGIMLFSLITNKEKDIIYYISDDSYYKLTKEIIYSLGITNIYYPYRYWKGVTTKGKNKKNIIYYWNSIDDIENEKDKNIFITLQRELNFRIKKGEIFIVRYVTNQKNIIELPFGIIDNQKMYKHIPNLSEKYYYEIKP